MNSPRACRRRYADDSRLIPSLLVLGGGAAMTCEDCEELSGSGTFEKAAHEIAASTRVGRDARRAAISCAVTAPGREEGARHRSPDGDQRPPQVDPGKAPLLVSTSGRSRRNTGARSRRCMTSG